MAPVFAHGRLRLYLLKLLAEAPRHGYEVIRLLQERFEGLYAPSAGTVYPRLAKLESEGLVTHTTEGGRKVYAITGAGRAELAARGGELAELELEIRESVAELAAEIRDDVRGAAGELRREVRAETGRSDAPGGAGTGTGRGEGEREAWRAAKEELRRAKQEWREQARQARDESRRAREDAQRARRQARDAQARAKAQAKEAQEHFQHMARQVQQQMQEHFSRGDWPTGLREGLSELTREFGRFGRESGFGQGQGGGPWGAWGGGRAPWEARNEKADRAREESPDLEKHFAEDLDDAAADLTGGGPGPVLPEWATGPLADGDPIRELERLLDRFRDDVRDAARDGGVTSPQLRAAREQLAKAAARITALLGEPSAE
ncbi:helix-turn-helix transcriptional regulator [Streptomyces sp. P6-2-1]|uniref:PadR family transcriptional regulator n=1 Tax=unclassified Streptomyces TaxID=2593676 RepID=UPI003D365F09